MKVALSQIPALSFQTAEKKIISYFEKSEGCSLLVFPEVFLQKGILLENYDHSVPIAAKKLIATLCKKYKIYCVMGTVIERVRGKYYNRSYLVGPSGIVGHYDKINIDRSEGGWRAAGKATPVFSTPFGKIGLQICRDLLYPEVSRGLMKAGADVIICPAFFNAWDKQYPAEYLKLMAKVGEPKEVDSFVPARSFENGVGFVFCNGSGKTSDYIGLGHSQVALPFFGTVAKLNHNREALLTYDIDMRIIAKAKEAYGLFF